jgi:electron transfer flavoprotein alpha subunit
LESPLLRSYQSDAYLPPLLDLAETRGPGIILLGATLQGLDLAPSLAARLKTGLAAHCIDLSVDELGHLVQLVPAPGQATVATIVCPNHWPQMATVKPGTFPISIQTGRTGQIVRIPVMLKVEDVRLVVEDAGATACDDASELSEAKVVVAGGAGIGSTDGWSLLEALAARLAGSVGASRPAVDAGWAPIQQMIGHSGRSIRPKVYIGVGISGDMLHMVGMSDAQLAVAINNNARAPIFAQVDLGIVGDYREVIPALLEALGAPN